jgi:hypothetical protein
MTLVRGEVTEYAHLDLLALDVDLLRDRDLDRRDLDLDLLRLPLLIGLLLLGRRS